mmetsp:Transcript_41137/g.118878  ORF Transcript_41137/g.118878 Transcript_41137/m.118878 type:complete len:209 (+) Transcript_41137:57-683(+)
MPAARHLLTHCLLLATAAGFVCPQPGTWGEKPRTDLGEGSKCGGACGFHGSCATGLVCQDQPANSWQIGMGGVKPPGVCIRKSGQELHPMLNPALELVNERINGLYMLVPVHLHSVMQHRSTQGPVYDMLVEVKPSTCWNDGKHKPGDLACEPLSESKSQFYALQVLDSMAEASGLDQLDRMAKQPRYSLMKLSPASSADVPANKIFV